MAPQVVAITGSLYHPGTGGKVTSGRLVLAPKRFIISNGELVSANVVAIDIPATGDLNFNLVPSNGVPYIVEFDPNPNDTTTPLPLKSGYFRNTWLVPSTGPVNINSL